MTPGDVYVVKDREAMWAAKSFSELLKACQKVCSACMEAECRCQQAEAAKRTKEGA